MNKQQMIEQIKTDVTISKRNKLNRIKTEMYERGFVAGCLFVGVDDLGSFEEFEPTLNKLLEMLK